MLYEYFLLPPYKNPNSNSVFEFVDAQKVETNVGYSNALANEAIDRGLVTHPGTWTLVYPKGSNYFVFEVEEVPPVPALSKLRVVPA